MMTKTLKLTLFVTLVACAAGGFGLGLAWGTPPQGFTATNLVGPVLFGDIYSKAETDDWEAELKVNGQSDVFVTHIRIVPGGHGGWHSHPGPSFIMVRSGTASFYDDCNGFIRQQYAAGTGFVEDAGCVHLLANEGNVDLEVIVVQLVPRGAPRRIDEPNPLDD